MQTAKQLQTTRSRGPGTPADFRIFLQQELLERCRKNPKYSLRAFAKSLAIAPSALSDMLNGRRAITANSVDRLGLAMGLSLKEIDCFKNGPTVSERSAATSAPKFQQITLDMFALISDWYHYAILELIKVDGFESSPKWIAKRLGVTRSEVNAAVERLVRLGLIEVKDDGTWLDISDGFSTNIEPGLTSAASRKLQKQILAQAIAAIDEVSLDRRNNTSMTMAINSEDLPVAIDKIAEFRRSLCKFLERNRKPTEVYQLAVSLFPVTQICQSNGDLI